MSIWRQNGRFPVTTYPIVLVRWHNNHNLSGRMHIITLATDASSDSIHVESDTLQHPNIGVLYRAPEPSKLDRFEGLYYKRAIMQHVQYSLKLKDELNPRRIFQRWWRVERYNCRGAKKCTSPSSACKRARLWETSSRR